VDHIGWRGHFFHVGPIEEGPWKRTKKCKTSEYASKTSRSVPYIFRTHGSDCRHMAYACLGPLCKWSELFSIAVQCRTRMNFFLIYLSASVPRFTVMEQAPCLRVCLVLRK
jgi:hypothetical protein